MLKIIFSLTVSLFIGLLLGIERERSHPEGKQAIGVRTFILIAILGTIAAIVNQTLITVAICSFVFGIILLSYFRSTESYRKHIDIGITTELAAGIVLILGYMTLDYPLLSLTISAVILFVLIERQRLHVFSRKKLKASEIKSILVLIIFGLGIVPILPNHTIDPWQLFNPRNIGILLMVIASIQFSGYIAVRLFGHTVGRAIFGFLGGFVSSTAVFLTLRDSLDGRRYKWETIASAILAIVATITEVAIILFLASPALLYYIAWPLVTMISVSMVIAVVVLRFQKIKDHVSQKEEVPLKLTSIFI